MRAGAEKRPSTRDNSPGRSASANATPKNATENAAVATPRPAVSVTGSRGLSISKAVEDVRGMARNGPMVRYMSAMNTEANSGLTRPASSRTPSMPFCAARRTSERTHAISSSVNASTKEPLRR